MKSGVIVKIDKLAKTLAAISAFTKMDVLVGVPREKGGREDGEPISNAALAYIHDRGAPEANIPARPFMTPGIRRARPAIVSAFRTAGKNAFLAVLGNPISQMERQLNVAGLAAQNAIRAVINEGIPPPLKPGTVRARRHSRGTKSRRKGELKYLELLSQGKAPAEAQTAVGIRPLVNTGQLRNSITYVVRRK